MSERGIEKREFIIRSFGHTHRKKYENYVITGIWHRLRANGVLIKPITQQLVKRPDGYALLDLYFPAINFAVECDEGQHFDNAGEYIPEDISRKYDVLTILAALPVKPHLRRINATKDLQEIDRQIADVAAEIEKKAEGKSPVELWPEEDPIGFVRERNGITVYDPIFFPHHNDILNAFGFRTNDGTPYDAWGKGKFVIDSEKALWFPNLIRQLGDARYANVWDEKTDDIYEYETEGKKNDWNEIVKVENYYRYAFCKIKDKLGQTGYKFYGKYRLKREVGIRRTAGSQYIVWEKVGDKISKAGDGVVAG